MWMAYDENLDVFACGPDKNRVFKFATKHLLKSEECENMKVSDFKLSKEGCEKNQYSIVSKHDNYCFGGLFKVRFVR